MYKSFLALLLVLQPLISFANPIHPFVTIAKQASPSIVFIATEKNPFDLSYGKEQGYYEYLRPIYDYLWPSEYTHGSGFIISPDGYIVTNCHVVQNTTKVMVMTRSAGPRIYQASVVGKDVRTDIAVLKIEDSIETPLPVLRFADSSQLQVGQEILCVGNPLFSQLEFSVTSGIISGIDRNMGFDPIEGHIQTDAVINPGNSGCPVLNVEGEVIGVISWGLKGRVEGISFAIPSHIALTIANQLIAHGRASQGFLGVQLEDDADSAFDAYYFDRNRGASIKTIIENSPAQKAGLQSSDLILKVDHHFVRSAKSLRNQIAILEPDTTVQLTLDRQGTIFEVILELGSEELSKTYSILEGVSIVI